MLDRNELILNYVNEELESVPSTINSKLTPHGVKLNTRLEFKNFEKNGDIKEVVMTKSLLEHYSSEISAIKTLLEEFEKIIK